MRAAVICVIAGCLRDLPLSALLAIFLAPVPTAIASKRARFLEARVFSICLALEKVRPVSQPQDVLRNPADSIVVIMGTVSTRRVGYHPQLKGLSPLADRC